MILCVRNWRAQLGDSLLVFMISADRSLCLEGQLARGLAQGLAHDARSVLGFLANNITETVSQRFLLPRAFIPLSVDLCRSLHLIMGIMISRKSSDASSQTSQHNLSISITITRITFLLPNMSLMSTQPQREGRRSVNGKSMKVSGHCNLSHQTWVLAPFFSKLQKYTLPSDRNSISNC